MTMIDAFAVIGKVEVESAISGADRIHSVEVVCGEHGRWSGVVSRDIKTDDLVAVFLPDALLPADERWKFMESRNWRVKQARFKGVPSEVLVLSLAQIGLINQTFAVGDDVTAQLGVTKYEKPLSGAIRGSVKGNFPSFIPKTDEVNFQKAWKYVNRMGEDLWYATEKADGSSCTVYVDNEGLHVCSRNYELKPDDEKKVVFWNVAFKYGLERLPQGVALQYEVVGPGIQKNPMGLKENEMRAFSLYDINERKYLPHKDLRKLCEELSLPMARLVSFGQETMTKEQLQDMADITYANGMPGEGIVIRASDSSWSFKVINLKYND